MANPRLCEEDIFALQDEISRYMETSSNKRLMQDIVCKISHLWMENRETWKYKTLVERLEKENTALRQSNKDLRMKYNDLKMTTVAGNSEKLQKQKNFYIEKCRKYEQHVLSFGGKCEEQEKLLCTVRREVSRLSLLFPPKKKMTGNPVETVKVNETSDRSVTESAQVPSLWIKRETASSNVRRRSGEKPFECTFEGCGKRFLVAAALEIHTNWHTREVVHECPWKGCGKNFTQPGSLKMHILTHTGEKPFKCTFAGCDVSFRLRLQLKSHMRVHANDAPSQRGGGHCLRSSHAVK